MKQQSVVLRRTRAVAPMRLSVVYDGDCNICTRVILALKRLDYSEAFALYDYHDESTIGQTFPHLDPADLTRAMYLIEKDGRTFRGYFALRRMLTETPLRPLATLFRVPVVEPLGVWVYNLVARNRRKLGCNSSACAVFAIDQ